MFRIRRSTRLAALAATGVLALAACGDDTTTDAGIDPAQTATGTETEMDPGMTETEMATESDTASDEMTEETAALPTGIFGPACGEVPTEGEGSAEGMADDPVATAASNNPLLSTLVDLVGQAGLADTLNSAEQLTVFAPTNEAFESLDPATLEAVQNDTDLLTTVLTYHVHGGEQLGAQELVDQGSITTLAEGAGELEVTADGETVTVQAAGSEATVVCGNVQTANATVHLVDSVLIPPMDG